MIVQKKRMHVSNVISDFGIILAWMRKQQPKNTKQVINKTRTVANDHFHCMLTVERDKLFSDWLCLYVITIVALVVVSQVYFILTVFCMENVVFFQSQWPYSHNANNTYSVMYVCSVVYTYNNIYKILMYSVYIMYSRHVCKWLDKRSFAWTLTVLFAKAEIYSIHSLYVFTHNQQSRCFAFESYGKTHTHTHALIHLHYTHEHLWFNSLISIVNTFVPLFLWEINFCLVLLVGFSFLGDVGVALCTVYVRFDAPFTTYNLLSSKFSTISFINI